MKLNVQFHMKLLTSVFRSDTSNWTGIAHKPIRPVDFANLGPFLIALNRVENFGISKKSARVPTTTSW